MKSRVNNSKFENLLAELREIKDEVIHNQRLTLTQCVELLKRAKEIQKELIYILDNTKNEVENIRYDTMDYSKEKNLYRRKESNSYSEEENYYDSPNVYNTNTMYSRDE